MLVDRITFIYCVYPIYLSFRIISMLSFRILLTKLLICNDFFLKQVRISITVGGYHPCYRMKVSVRLQFMFPSG